MSAYRFSNKAVADLSGIWNYTCDKWSEKQADRYYAMLLQVCKKIAGKPTIGKKYDEVYIGLLGYKASQHIIFYRVVAVKEIEIVRILHSRMDIANRIGD